MTSLNIDHLTAAELGELIRTAEQRRDALKQERLQKVKKQCIDLAASEGFVITDLFDVGSPRLRTSVRNARDAKYRNPEDPTQTWGGHGKRPSWFKAALEAGKSERELRI